jgi:2,3-bisphosphoglycerate-dependent phosphoglycerate mutase
MPPTQLIAIRHGETAWNRTQRYQGHEDIALNEAGFSQACDIANSLANTPLDAVYTSDLKRAYQTATALAVRLALPSERVSDLREQHFGLFQGLTGEEIARQWPQASERWHRREPDFGPPGGETRNEFSQRCVTAIEKLTRAHPGGTIAVICHGGVLDCLYRAASRLPMDAPRAWPLANAAINYFSYDSVGFHIQRWGETSHLQRNSADELREHFSAP